MSPKPSEKRILSGIAATGDLHIGNYVGAISLWVASQAEAKSYYCIADLHALTTPESIQSEQFRSMRRRIAALYVACGIDPDVSTIFFQSQISAHTELAWILNCVTPVGWLERMTQYKARRTRQGERGSGLLTYPVLQAADILLYQANLVPVGDDQKQHIELTRNIAIRFHRLFGPAFTMPEHYVRETGARIMGLDDPKEKMSKSLAVDRRNHAIGLLDKPETVARVIRAAVTDARPVIDFENLSPGVSNLLTLTQVLTNRNSETLRHDFEGRSYRYLKAELIESIIQTVTPIQHAYDVLMDVPGELDLILERGREEATTVAGTTLTRVKSLVGL